MSSLPPRYAESTPPGAGRPVRPPGGRLLRSPLDRRQEQSIPEHRKAIERGVADSGLEFARFFVDDAISGTSAIRRPAFQEMVGRAQQERRPFSYVIVYDVKRFGRLGRRRGGVKQWQAREESKDRNR